MRTTATSLGSHGGRRACFTLLELLVVLGIIGALAAISLPAIRGMMQSNVTSAANRQFLDDVALAQRQAISHRTTVHILFSPDLRMDPYKTALNSASPTDQKVGKRLESGVYTTYALFAERTVGDQPGQPHFRYLTAWKTLPDGVFIADREYRRLSEIDWFSTPDAISRPFKFVDLPFPTSTGPVLPLPHIAFDAQGSLVGFDRLGNRVFHEEVIELARGSILSQRDDNGNLIFFDAKEKPPNNSVNNYNRIRIDGLTGRARVERPEIQ